MAACRCAAAATGPWAGPGARARERAPARGTRRWPAGSRAGRRPGAGVPPVGPADPGGPRSPHAPAPAPPPHCAGRRQASERRTGSARVRGPAPAARTARRERAARRLAGRGRNAGRHPPRCGRPGSRGAAPAGRPCAATTPGRDRGRRRGIPCWWGCPRPAPRRRWAGRAAAPLAAPVRRAGTSRGWRPPPGRGAGGRTRRRAAPA
jgi:hypothetical protein